MNSWDEWFDAVKTHIPAFERYENALRRYYKARGTSELFGRPHRRGFYEKDFPLAQKARGSVILFAFIGVFFGVVGSFVFMATQTGELNPVIAVIGTLLGAVAFAVLRALPSVVGHFLRVNGIRKAEIGLERVVSLMPQQFRNSTCAKLFADAHDAYNYHDFESASRAVTDAVARSQQKGGYRNVQAMIDVPFDGTGLSRIARVAGRHDDKAPNLPEDIKGHTRAGAADWRRELSGLVGMTDVKKQVRKLENRVKVHGGSGAAVIGGNNMVLMGPAGVGKTTVARILTGMLADAGIIQENRIVEVDGDYLKSPYQGQTGKRTEAVCKWAEGGVLFIDEAYLLFDEKGNSNVGREATGVLLKYMEDHTQDLVVMLAGYTDDMERLIASNDGFRSRVRHKIRFSSYTAHELAEICGIFLGKTGLTCQSGVLDKVEAVLGAEAGGAGFGGAREARNAADALIDIQADRVAERGGDARVITVEDADAWAHQRTKEGEETRHDYLATSGVDEKIVSASELEQRTRTVDMPSERLLKRLVGQDAAKSELDAWKAKTAMLGGFSGNANVALLGPAGVGKTTFAEVVTRTLFEAGRIREPRMLDVTGDWFRANFVGQTGTRTEAAIQWARGGVLFIDEAYLMVDAGGSDFGSQALGVLVNDMEKMDDLVVIVAGYTEQMQAFFAQNPGVASRVATTIELAPYTVRELMLILQRMARSEGFKLASDVYRTLQPGVEAHMGEVDFGQGRAMRNVLQHMVSAHAARWSKDRSLDRHLLDAEDARMAMTRMGW